MKRTTFVTTTLALAVLMMGVIGSPPQAAKADPPQVYMMIDNPTPHDVFIEFNTAKTKPWLRTTIRSNTNYRWSFEGTFQLVGYVKVGTTDVAFAPREVTVNAYHKAHLILESDSQGKYFFK
jgi:hypothetical protein